MHDWPDTTKPNKTRSHAGGSSANHKDKRMAQKTCVDELQNSWLLFSRSVQDLKQKKEKG
jgi:hypothetical protein